MLLMITLIVPLFLSGCFYYCESTGEDPLSHVFAPFSQMEAAEFANKVCAKFSNEFKSTVLKQEDLLQGEVNEILNEIIVSYRDFETSSKYFSYYDSFSFFLKTPIKIKIFSISKPLALSYPNGEIHFSRSILDGGLSYSAKNKAQRIGLVAHEFIHVIHGHVGYQWAAIEAYSDFEKRRLIADLTKLTKLLPFSYTLNVYSYRDLSEVHITELIIEHLADFATVILLEHMGYNPEQYITFLKGLRSYEKENEIPERNSWLNHRIDCLEKMLIIMPHHLPKCLVIRDIGLEKTYKYLYKIRSSPVLVKLAGYWTCVLSKLGRPPYVENFIIYDIGKFLPISQGHNYATTLQTDDGQIYPVEICDGLVIPEKISVFPLVPFTTQ